MKDIYCFTNLINGKKYIGSTITGGQNRYKQHIYNSSHPNAHQYNYPLYQAIRKYGLNNFKFEIIDTQDNYTEQELRLLEKEYIIKFNCISPNGYNQTLDTEHPINDERTYQKIRETKRGNAKEVAEVNSNNEILKIWRSIIDCAEDIQLDEKKIAAVCRGERKSTGGRIFYWIDENKNLLIPEYKRDEYKGEKGTTQIQSSSRKVAKLDPQTGEVLAIYDTIALAARENKCDNSALSKVCRGIRHKCGGFGWKYID